MPKPTKGKTLDTINWVSVDLTAKQTEDMKSRFPDWEAVSEVLLKGIESGYKYTLSYDTRNKCFSAYLIPVMDTSPNTGCILSCRGSSPFSAFRGLGYRHFIVFNEIWGERASAAVDQD